jgi:hypothetical protein|tara:strand:- start:4294 stop:4434 length:141 start_codon:yes stop_codon:yes gene_type:complete
MPTFEMIMPDDTLVDLTKKVKEAKDDDDLKKVIVDGMKEASDVHPD